MVPHNRDSDDEAGDDDFQAHIFRTNFRDDLDDVVRKYLIFVAKFCDSYFYSNNFGLYPF